MMLNIATSITQALYVPREWPFSASGHTIENY
jgi:hypothetical protein